MIARPIKYGQDLHDLPNKKRQLSACMFPFVNPVILSKCSCFDCRLKNMRVLIADKFEQSGRDGLQALGCEISFQPDLKDDALVEAIAKEQPDVLVVRGTKVTEPMLAAGPLKLIVRAGAGYNTIDVASASRRGIYVSNCPGKNSIAVAELAFALILALDRRIADNVVALRAGEWNKKEFSRARGLFGRTLGLVTVAALLEHVGRASVRPRR